MEKACCLAAVCKRINNHTVKVTKSQIKHIGNYIEIVVYGVSTRELGGAF